MPSFGRARWITNLGLDGATFVFKEFWSDMNSRIFHQKNSSRLLHSRFLFFWGKRFCFGVRIEGIEYLGAADEW
jgi:hypothetical protein